MAKNSIGFQFKQFFIAHDCCAMKVNTDGILLGALANISQAQNILDLGTGSGLIAIMLAQRTACNANIIAVELDEDAFQQAKRNAINSPFGKQITIQQADIFQLNFAIKFDLIVSNPPYFEQSLNSNNPQRNLARQAIQSNFAWLKQAANWITTKGKICFILPLDIAEKLIEQAQSLGLYCIEKWLVYTKISKLPKRAIITFSPTKLSYIEKTVTIYQENNQYTSEFKRLTQDFYLNF
ncbi:tRNA (adenosine(37)-N6)-methyltransferase TrmM [Vespertiliibacter pulmonis]|uniref:tRNA1(Val) (adenine(37)-N6)-methyltransferase n=1 Tax=Vespertiliibacter pulmonis TaxID=1443036 RepID=A0A3N4VZS0_9PAST|nr:methyltransferase [Vespertiliibacter pulmonis]QLB20529.1 tRNA (adenosine(37)-N6)-methyltransferase TrmM [Vespertiliibacter pulmonis]RPE82657.1 tRNA1Val (adenine37-N6)-methyltransferase [Vespertiliibacter pulmonis]